MAESDNVRQLTALCNLEWQATKQRLSSDVAQNSVQEPDQLAEGMISDVEMTYGDEAEAKGISLDDFECAVNAALAACEASSPGDRFRLIETPYGSFLLVTNVLPRKTHIVSDESNESQDSKKTFVDGLELFDTLANLGQNQSGKSSSDTLTGRGLVLGTDNLDRQESGHGMPWRRTKSHEYALRNINRLSYNGQAAAGSYVIYTRHQLEVSLSLDKRDLVDSFLAGVNTPGIADHYNVSDMEALAWLLFCGPRSYCESDRCFGCEVEHFDVPFPALLPPIFYDPVRDYATYLNLGELYVYSWYRDYPLEDMSENLLSEVSQERIVTTLRQIRERFDNQDVPVWSIASRMCIFCTLYNQNRVCLDFAKRDTLTTVYSPIIIRDYHRINTDVTLSHVLPGEHSVSLFPVYDIGALLSSIKRSGERITLDL